MKKQSMLWIGLLLVTIAEVNSYNVLMMIAFGGKSHKVAVDPVAEELVKNGHQVTMMTLIKQSKEQPGVKNVYLSKVADVMDSRNFTFFSAQGGADTNFLAKVFGMCQQLCTATYLEEPELQKLIKDPSASPYDVMIMDAVMNDWLFALGHHLGIPIILISPALKMPSIAWSMNIPTPYSYIPFGIDFITDDMTFFQRFQNMGIILVYHFAREYYLFGDCDKTIRKVIPNSPPLSELEATTAFLLTNSHPAIHHAVPSMPNFKEVGCLHCKEARALPKDLEDFMQSSGDDGVIYFSLGSATKGNEMPIEMRDKVIEAFAKLPQKILWKYETDIEGLPKNIKLTKWAPQQDILAHAKTRLFITHGGGLSTFETAYHACPILGFPLSADQWGNIGIAVGKGFAECLDWRTFTTEEFLENIQRMLTDTRYQTTVDHLSSLLKDQPQDPLTTAVYWIEYVVRHNGAHHLKSAAMHLNFFQYFLLDVIAVFLSVAVIVALVAYFSLKKLCRMCFSRGTCATSKNQKQKKTKLKKN